MSGSTDSVLKSDDKNWSSESVLLMSSKKSLVESSKSVAMQHFRGAVTSDVYVISVSSENLSRHQWCFKKLRHTEKQTKGNVSVTTTQ